MDLAAAAKLPGVVKNLRQNLELRGLGKSNCLTKYTSSKVSTHM
jgi:hypothetical protein